MENIREVRLRWLEHVERKTEEDVVMRTWKWTPKDRKTKTENVKRKDKKEKGVQREKARDRKTWRMKV